MSRKTLDPVVMDHNCCTYKTNSPKIVVPVESNIPEYIKALFFMPKELSSIVASFLVCPFRVGDYLEVKDPFGKWYLCTVLKTSVPNLIYIHYQGTGEC